MTELEARIEAAMAGCYDCQRLAGEAREKRKSTIRQDIDKQRARPPRTLGAAAWPLGRPWEDTGAEGASRTRTRTRLNRARETA